MITKHNISNEQYALLFKKAEELLGIIDEKGDVIDEEQTRINSLDLYFTRLGDIVNTMVSEIGSGARQAFDESFFLLPLDEPMFEIDADKREIAIPSAFKNGVAVQGDNASEVLVFKIDRYFDYKDLGSEKITIYIQYTTPDGKESMYQVGYKDLDSYPGYVRFGWILSDVATKDAGALKFSVRFISTAEDGSADYSFNTKSHQVLIYPALQKGMTAEKDSLSSDNIFSKLIVNSLEKGVVPAQTPSFSDEYASLNLEKTANLKADNTYTFIAQASKGDLGTLQYEWFFKPVSTEENPTPSFEKIENNGMFDTGLEYIKKEGVVGPSLRKEYYYYDAAKTQYVKYNFDPQDTELPELYEKYAICKILNTTDPIVGEYYATASNIITPGKNVSSTVRSNICVIPGLQNFTVTKNLEYENGLVLLPTEETIAETDEETGEIVNHPIYAAPSWEIEFETDPASYYKATLYRKPPKGDTIAIGADADPVFTEDGKVKIVREFKDLDQEGANEVEGLYSYKIEITKNRDVKATEYNAAAVTIEDPCTRVTFAPELPPREGEPDYILATDVDGIFTLESDVTEDGIYALEENEGKSAIFISDGYEYVWEIKQQDFNVFTTIPEDAIYLVQPGVDEEYGQGYPVIKINKEKLPFSGTIQCRVRNTLNGSISDVVFSNAFGCSKPQI